MTPSRSVANQKPSLRYLNLEAENSNIGGSLEYRLGQVNLGAKFTEDPGRSRGKRWGESLILLFSVVP